jgi:hypothetical protein
MPAWGKYLAACHERVADDLRTLERFSEALAEYDATLELCEALVTASPKDPSLRSSQVGLLYKMASCDELAKGPAAAILRRERALEVISEMQASGTSLQGIRPDLLANLRRSSDLSGQRNAPHKRWWNFWR